MPARFWTLKKELARFLARDLEIIVDGLARMLGQLKSNGSPGLSLTHRSPVNCVTIGSDTIHRNCDNVAAPQFTVDRKIEHRQVTFTPLNLEHGAHPQTCFCRSGGLAPTNLPLFQGAR